MKSFAIAAGALALGLAAPVAAQDQGADEESVYDGDYLAVGIGVAYAPSYDGSDDYVVYPVPLVQASFRGIEIDPRTSGLALDFVPDGDGRVGFDLGIAGRLRQNRARGIKDPVVKRLGELDTAIEVGPTAGVSLRRVLNPYDSLSIGADVRWDVAGAHGGMTADPRITYFTPLSRGAAASLTLSADYGDGDFADYYYSITPAGAAVSGLPAFDADGGFTKAGASLLFGIDLNGNLEDGGFALVLAGGYQRMLGDAKRSPVTSIRGSADQWLGAIGIGYTF